MDKPLNKFKKKALISLIKNYESDILELQTELDNIKIESKRIEYVVVKDDEDDKTLKYIKNRVLVIQDPHRRAIYSIELERLLKLIN